MTYFRKSGFPAFLRYAFRAWRRAGIVAFTLFLIFFPLLLWRIRWEFCAIDKTRRRDDAIPPFSKRARAATKVSSLYAGETLCLNENGIPSYYWFDTKRLGRTGTPLFLPEKVFTSGTILGSPGSGKTQTAVALACGHLEDPRRVVVYIDCKADESWVFRTLESRCKELGRKFLYVSTEGEPSLALNPVELLADTAPDRSSFCKHLTQAMGVGQGLKHGFYEGEARSFLQLLLTEAPDASSFERMSVIAGDEKNKRLYPSRNRYDSVAGLRSALEEYAAGSQFCVSRFDPAVPKEVRENAVDFQKMLQEGGCCLYIRARRFHSLIPLITRALFESCRVVNGDRAEHERTPVALYCDELHRALPYAPGLFGEIIALSRAVQMTPVVFIMQNLAQAKSAAGLGADGNALVSELMSCPVTLYGGSTDAFTPKLILQEWGREQFETTSTAEGPNGKTTTVSEAYRRVPRVREALIEWLSTDSNSSRCFLARVARSEAGFYSVAQATPATDYATFKKLEALGWPTEGEFEGALSPRREPIFAQKSSSTLPQEKDTKTLKPSPDPAVAQALGKFA